MYRILYHTATGRIESCRNISDSTLARNLELNSHLSSINAFTNKPNDFTIVDGELVAIIKAEDEYTAWMKNKRNLLLAQSDWTQAIDSPLTDAKKSQWQTYRQTLRDLPTNYVGDITDRDSVEWPTQPE
tara:strand:- start:4501 stop:4887 length:387 start_codon:yes stop_codon:yes gene_type:complete